MEQELTISTEHGSFEVQEIVLAIEMKAQATDDGVEVLVPDISCPQQKEIFPINDVTNHTEIFTDIPLNEYQDTIQLFPSLT